VSAQPPAKNTAGLIEKETLKKANDKSSSGGSASGRSKECILAILLKKNEQSETTLRHSAVGCLIQAIETASLIIN
jgi:hypothetical protein